MRITLNHTGSDRHAPMRIVLQTMPAALVASVGLLAPMHAEAVDAGATTLSGLRHHTLETTTVPANGDQNPYAVVVAAVTQGRIEAGDVLVSNFNDRTNLQGLGTTIVDYRPSTGALSTFAALPHQLAAGGPACPGGIGLTTAMTQLSNGDLIVGSLPSRDGTTATKRPGCLLVLDPSGQVVSTITGSDVNGPWGNMALSEHPGGGTLFVSNTGFSVGGPDGTPPVVPKATIVRFALAYGPDAHPRVTATTVVANGFGEQADKSVFIIGPTGLALDPSGTLYASDALGNRIVAIDDALTRTDSAGTGREVTKDGLLNRPLALIETPDRHLLTTNGLNGQVVEIDASSGTQLGAQWFDTDKAQTPPGSGDLFGLALKPGGGIYYVEDDMNTLLLAHR